MNIKSGTTTLLHKLQHLKYVNRTTTGQYGLLDCDAMYYNKTGNNVSEQSLASVSIRVQSEPKVIVHLPEMSIFRVPVH
jgi:hypothetical protein